MTYDTALENFRCASHSLVPISCIRTAEALQPRVARLIPIRDKGRFEQSSDQHVSTLRLALEASEQTVLDPIWIADIGDAETVDAGLYLIDGHHRLSAYKQARRDVVPASILPMTWHSAVVVSKLVNCTGRSLALHNEQRRDAAWQYVAALTHRGAIELPKGESLRSIAGRFGISKNTVNSMLTRLPQLGPPDLRGIPLDPGTGWPRWRYVRDANTPWRTDLKGSEQERLDRDAERIARLIIKLVDGSTPVVRARALQMLAEDEVAATNQAESVELLVQLSSSARLPVPMGTPAVPAQLAHLDN